MYDKRNKLTEQVENDVRTCLGKLVYKTTIPRNVKVSEALLMVKLQLSMIIDALVQELI